MHPFHPRDGNSREQARLHLLRRPQRNSRLYDRPRIEAVNDVDLRLRASRLHGHGETNLMPVITGTRMLSEGLRTLYEKLIDAQAKIDIASRE